MILTCPQCATRYLLPAHMLTPEGRRVKCSNCVDTWFQLPDSTELDQPKEKFDDIPDGVKPLQEGTNLPTVSEEVPIPAREFRLPGGRKGGYVAAAGTFVVILALLFLMEPVFANSLSFTKKFYSLFGYPFPVAGEGLVFDGMTAQKSKEGNKEKLVIAGTILNLKYQSAQVPMIEASMRNDKGEVLEHWIIRPPADHLGPKGELPFNTEYKMPESGSPRDINLRFILKTASADDDNNPVPGQDDQAHPTSAE